MSVRPHQFALFMSLSATAILIIRCPSPVTHNHLNTLHFHHNYEEGETTKKKTSKGLSSKNGKKCVTADSKYTIPRHFEEI